MSLGGQEQGEVFSNKPEDVVRGEVSFEVYAPEAAYTPVVGIVALLAVSSMLGEKVGGNQDRKTPPKTPPPMALPASIQLPPSVKLQDREISLKIPEPMAEADMAGKELSMEEKRMDEAALEKTTLRTHEIKDRFAIVFHDPVTGKVDIHIEEQPIHYDTIESKVVDVTVANRDVEKAESYIAEGIIKDKTEEIDKKVKQVLESPKKGFGHSLETDLMKLIEKEVDHSPRAVDEVAKRKAALLKELDKREKLLKEALDVLKKDGWEAFKKKVLPKFSKMTQKRLLWLMEHYKDANLLVRILLIEEMYVKWLKKRLASLPFKAFLAIAKNLLAKSILGFLKSAK